MTMMSLWNKTFHQSCYHKWQQ